MTAPRMTDARLDRIREMVTEGVLDDHVGTLAELLAELDRREVVADLLRVNLLGARAEAQRYRSRCPVTAEDVDEAGVTRVQCRAWLLALDGARVPEWSVDEGGSVPNGLIVVWTDDGSGDTETIYFDAGGASAIASAIRNAQPYTGDGDVAQLDILAEMAAMAEEPSQ